MNMTPDFSGAWQALRDRAAAQLPPNFADNVLRRLRQPALSAREIADRLLVAACTAAACVVVVVFMHIRATQKINQVALAGWRQVSEQADSFASVP
jgi:hypothetical protein